MSKRNCLQPHLLRGLMKCGLCGLTYSGFRVQAPQRDHYYKCNGCHIARGIYGINGKKCPSKILNGPYVEGIVWADIESFLRNPGELLERLRERMSMQDGERKRRQTQLEELTGRLQQKTGERDRVLGLFRRGRNDDATLDQQLDSINAEASALQIQIATETRALSARDTIGDHMLRRRLVLKLFQSQVAERLGVNKATICNWEINRTKPGYEYMPAIMKFLGYNPLPPKDDWAGRLVQGRTTLGLSQEQTANRLGVDPCTLARWERGEREPAGAFATRVSRFLSAAEATWAPVAAKIA